MSSPEQMESNSFNSDVSVDEKKDKSDSTTDGKTESPEQTTIPTSRQVGDSSSEILRSNQSSSLTESDLRTTSSNAVTVSFTESERTSRSSSFEGDDDNDDDEDDSSGSDDTSSSDSEDDEESDKTSQMADFSGQGFNVVPSIIFHRTTITKLNLSNNSLSFLPSEICVMINLRYLDISHNNLRGYSQVPGMSSTGVFQMKSGGDKVQLSGGGGGGKSTSSARKSHVQSLNNSNNINNNIDDKTESTQFPKDMNRLVNLKTLKMSSCELKVIPKIIFQLTSLTKLDLSDNWTTELPAMIGNLVELRYLLIKRMGLNTFPIQIINCSKLHTINAYGNEITSLPDEFSRLHKLKALHLDYRHFVKGLIKPRKSSKIKMVSFTEFTDEATLNTTTTNSTTISEVDNPRKSIEESSTSIAERIDSLLRSGQMKSYHIPSVIFKLRRLQVLHLDRCQLNFLPENLAQMKGICELHLSKNYFREIPCGLFTLGNTLEYLDLSYNQLDEVNGSVVLPNNFGSKFIVLKTLKLSSMNLTSIGNGVLCGMTKLKLLDLSYNKISQIPEDISALVSLKDFYLSENKLTSLPDAICQLKELTTLDLSFNQLNSLPEKFYLLKNLQASHQYDGLNKCGLWLQGNPLNFLPHSVWKTTDTKNLWKYLEDQSLKKLSENTEPTKIIVIGDKFSGKSLLIKHLIHECSRGSNQQVNATSQLNEISLNHSDEGCRLKNMLNTTNYVNLPLQASPILINHCTSPNGYGIVFYEINLPPGCSEQHVHCASLCSPNSGLELILPHILDAYGFFILVFNVNLLCKAHMGSESSSMEEEEESLFDNSIWSYLRMLRMYAPGSVVKLVGISLDETDIIRNNNNNADRFMNSTLSASLSDDSFIAKQENLSKPLKSTNLLTNIQFNQSDETRQNNKHDLSHLLQWYVLNKITQLSDSFQFLNSPVFYKHEAEHCSLTVLENVSFLNLSSKSQSKSEKIAKPLKNKPTPSFVYTSIDDLWNEIEHRINFNSQSVNKSSSHISKSWLSLSAYIHDKLKSSFMVQIDVQSRQNIDTSASPDVDNNNNNQLVLNKTFFEEMSIDNIEDCLNYFHTTGQLLYFSKHKYLKNYLILRPGVFFSIIHGILNPQIIASVYSDDDVNDSKENCQHHRWYLRALTGYTDESLTDYFSTWKHHKSFPYQMIRCLLPPFAFHRTSHPNNQMMNKNQQQHRSLQHRHMTTSKRSHHLEVPSSHHTVPTRIISRNMSKSAKGELKPVGSQIDNFELSISSISPLNVATQKVLLLTELLEAGFIINEKCTINCDLEKLQPNEMKPFVVYPCLFFNNQSLKVSSTCSLQSLNSECKADDDDSNNKEEFVQEIWFPLGRPMGYFNRLTVCLSKILSGQVRFDNFSNSVSCLKYVEKVASDKSITTRNTFTVEHDCCFDIRLEEVTVDGSVFDMPQCHCLHGIRCVFFHRVAKCGQHLSELSEPREITFDPVAWFTDTCIELNNEIPGLYWFWSK
ncbi:unnamed protein product [Trichobilharzia szidati]|nr:unnamed protein product [Trichobilharzia szidati]